MTVNELLDAMREASFKNTEDGEGLTITEICNSADMGDGKARMMMRQLLADGSARVSRKWVTAIDGSRRRVPSYVLIENPTAKAKARR